MPYRVFWSPEAERFLEQLLTKAAEPESLVAAARKVDRYLITDPQRFGESRYDNVRIGFEQPLAVQFEVLEDVRTVIVFHVRQMGRTRG